MIRKSEPLSIAESMKYLKEEGNEEIIGFAKKFVKLSSEEATNMRNKLNELELMKLRDIHIIKIIDLMPESAEELNRIFVDVSLDEGESKKVLDIVSEFK